MQITFFFYKVHDEKNTNKPKSINDYRSLYNIDQLKNNLYSVCPAISLAMFNCILQNG